MSTSSEINLYEKNQLTTKDKFYLFMNLLVSNQSSTRMECALFFTIFYIQYLSEFFSPNINVFNTSLSHFDNILYYFQKISRLKNLIDEHNSNESLHVITVSLLLTYDILLTLIVLLSILTIQKNSLYNSFKKVINYIIKSLLYIIYNINLDFCFSYFSYPNKRVYHIVLCLITFLYTTIIKLFIQHFYSDTLYLSASYYAKISSNYDIYFTAHSICFAFISKQCHNLTREFFFVYNLILSGFFFYYYSTHYIYYDKVTNCLCGIFHLWYVYISFFCFIFYYVNVKEKGIVFIISSLFIVGIYFNLRKYIEKSIFLKNPFYKISNKYFVLFYLKTMIETIDTIEQVDEDKSLITGIIQMHIVECPNDLCIMKHNRKIYLPINQTWSYRDKPIIYDKVFLINFIVAVMNFYIAQSYYSADMLINLSFYYLSIIGNNCLCLLYYKKVSEMKLTLQETFAFKRLSFAIEKIFVEKLKGQNEPCFTLEDLNVSYYFKYEQLSNKFYSEINKDVNFLIKFWESFIKEMNDTSNYNNVIANRNINNNTNYDDNRIKTSDEINYSKIFDLTNKIRVSKRNVEMIWEELFDLYNGINENFELYLNYIENINDDGIQKRELENFKRKSENSAENYQLNFYNILFGKETGIIIINGDQGKEGVIEKVNKEIENIFLYSLDELKGMNISQLMPKIFEEQHTKFIQNYFNIGEKKIIDNKDFKTYAKDKSNSIVLIKKNVKLFPMLNSSVYFVAMIIKEKINDIIFIDDKLTIQGVSGLLKKKILQSDNNNVFIHNEIPFYVICKKFVNFYKIFIKNEKGDNANGNNNNNNLSDINSIDIEHEGSGFNGGNDNNNNDGQSSLNNNGEGNNNNNNHYNIFSSTFIQNQSKVCKSKKNNRQFKENIEINENIELEYEIKVPKFLCDYIHTEMNKNFSLLHGSHQNMTEEAENHLLPHNNTPLPNEATPNANTTTQTPKPPTPSNSKAKSFKKDTKSKKNVNTSNNNSKAYNVPQTNKPISNITINVITAPANDISNDVNVNTSHTNINLSNINTQSNIETNKNNLNIHLLHPNNLQNNHHTVMPQTNTKHHHKDSIKHTYADYGLSTSKKIHSLQHQIECEEKEFHNKLIIYRELFSESKYTELEEYIDLNTKDSPVEFKFNFTFDIYKYGEDSFSYVIRCIDNNRTENDLSDNASDNNIHRTTLHLKKEILDSLKPEIELLYEEKAELKNLPEHFLNLLLENKTFGKMISDKKEEINKNSRIHGRKYQYEQVQEDENSSQASSSSYNEDLCKRNRIEEIRGNTLKSISNFYTLNYIRTVVIGVFICSFTFFVLYLINIESVYQDMKIISLVNIALYENCIWFANLISSIISLKTMIEFNNASPPIYTYNSYIQNNEEYFNTMKNMSLFWYKQILSTEGYISKNINRYMNSEKELFWKQVPITYGLLERNVNDDGESYPLSILQVLSNVNYLLEDDKYTYNMNYNELNDIEKNIYDYIHYMVIENAFLNILPSQLYKLQQIPQNFNSYTNGSRYKLKLIIIVFAICVTIFIIVYAVLVYKTKKSMGEGFGKVAKIKQDKIEELLKKLEMFKLTLHRFVNKDKYTSLMTQIQTKGNNSFQESNSNNNIEDEAKESLIPQSNAIHNSNNNIQDKSMSTPKHTPNSPIHNSTTLYDSFSTLTNQTKNINNILINSTTIHSSNTTTIKPFLSSSAKMKKRFGKISPNDNANNSLSLRSLSIDDMNNIIGMNITNKDTTNKTFSIVSSSIIQTFLICCFFILFLLLISLISESIVNKTGRILDIESFFLGKGLITVTETIKIKCEMSLCKTSNTTINFSSLISQDLNRKIANWVSTLDYLNTFYEQFYMQNACLAAVKLNESNFGKDIQLNIKNIYEDDNYKQCMNDILVKSANNTEGLIQLVDNKVKIIRNEIEINKNTNESFHPCEMYSNNNFYVFEKVFYKYLVIISDNFSYVITQGYEEHLNKMVKRLTIIMIVFVICILIASIYIGVFYIQTLVHLLSVSRCILKIIPTAIISSTPELEMWIEASY